MKKIKILIPFILLLLASSIQASLLNTTDQVLNRQPALGGNTAVSAYNKVNAIEIGGTFWGNYFENSVNLNGNTEAIPPLYQNLNQYYQFTYPVNNNQWICFGYSNNHDATSSFILISNTTPESRYKAYVEAIDESTYLRYAWDLSKSINGLYFGTEVAVNKKSSVCVTRQNEASKIDHGEKLLNSTTIFETDPFTTYAFGLIYSINKANLISLYHKPGYYYNYLERGHDLDNIHDRSQNNAEASPATALGYLKKVNEQLEVALAVTVFSNINYKRQTVERIENQAYTKYETEEYIRTSPLYTIGSEYKFSSDLACQGTISWLSYNENKPSNLTYTTLNLVKNWDAHKFIIGFYREKSLIKNIENVSDISEENRLYVNYGYSWI
ncbi:MAG: hypothetical protein KKA19_06240 [Candidatus Margulisbacteria bacterium]|nr:hypothetical protein [Candidatus Margulisiibacteriota bacterium]